MDALEPLREIEHLREAHIRLDSGAHLLDELRQARQDLRRDDLREHGLHELLLAADTADIALAVAVAHILDGLLAVHVLLARIEIDDEAAVVVPGILVVHALLHVDIDAADGVDDALERARIDDDIVIHRHAEELLHRRLAQRVPAERVGVVRLVIAVPVDGEPRIARHGEQCALAALRIERRHHERIAAAHIIRALVDAEDHDMDRMLPRHQPWRSAARAPPVQTAEAPDKTDAHE